MNNERIELQQLSTSFASEIGRLQSLLASDPSKIDNANADSDKSDTATNSQIQSCMAAIYSVANNLHTRMDRMQSSMWAYQDSHEAGHLPKCPSVEHMNAAIKSLGWDKNYEVKKKTVYASTELFAIKN